MTYRTVVSSLIKIDPNFRIRLDFNHLYIYVFLSL